MNPIGCADCHEPQSMGLRVTRSFLKSAYKRNGLRIEDATEQEMRSLVCAQCHAEYYFQGEDRILALPWDQGYTVENIEAYYDSINFTDFTHKLSRAHLIKAQHPDSSYSRWAFTGKEAFPAENAICLLSGKMRTGTTTIISKPVGDDRPYLPSLPPGK